MFDLYCHICGSVHLVGSRSILSLHNTSKGVIAYARCPEGHTVVVEFAKLDPYQARKQHHHAEVPAAA